MSYKVLPLALLTFSLLFPLYVSSDSYASSGTANTCELKVLIQVPLLGDNRVSDKDQVINGKYWYYDLEQAVYYLRDKLESYTKCHIRVDYQLRFTPRPRHWWTPEYGGNQPEINLVSNYNLIIFIGHGNPGRIDFLSSDTNKWGASKNYVVFSYSNYIDEDGTIRYISISHIRGKSWIITIGCSVLSSFTTIVKKGIDISSYQYNGIIDIEKYLFNNGSNTEDLSKTYLMGILGFDTVFPYMVIYGFDDIGLALYDLIIDDFVEELADYLVGNMKIVDLWFKVVTAFSISQGLLTIKPAVLYPIIIDKDQSIIVYDPNKPLYKIYYMQSPSKAYNVLISQHRNIKVKWIYATSLTGVKALYYLGAGAKALIKYMITQRVLSHGKGGGGWRLWGARVILKIILLIIISSILHIHYASDMLLYQVDHGLDNNIDENIDNHALKIHSRSNIVLDKYNYMHSNTSFTNITYEKGLPYIDHPLPALLNTTLFTADLITLDSNSEPYILIPAGYWCNYECEFSYKAIEYSNNDLYVWKFISSSNKYTAYVSSFGLVNITYGDGKIDELYLMNESEIRKIIQYLWGGIYGDISSLKRLNFSILTIDIVYAGIGAERIDVTYETRYIIENDTLIPIETPVTKLYNPYYKFYVVINGVRIGYPIQIGCENRNNTLFFKFIKLYIPLFSSYELVVIDNDYLNVIYRKIVEVVGFNVSINDIIIEDIYYLPTEDFEYLTPVLILYINTTDTHYENKTDILMVIRLYKDHVVLEEVYRTLGKGYEASDPIAVIDNIVAHIILFGNMRTIDFSSSDRGILEIDLTPILLIAIITTISVGILIKWSKKHK